MKGKSISKWLLFAMSGMIMAGTMLPAGAEEPEQVMEETIVKEDYEDVLLPEEEIVLPEETDSESENEAESSEVAAVEIADEIVVEAIELYSSNDIESGETTVEESSESYGTVIESGNCGASELDNLIWTIYDSDMDTIGDTLVISGNGAMADYTDSTMPWFKYSEDCKYLILEEGISYIGAYAFTYFRGFTGRLWIPDSVKDIGEDAFSYCSGFTKLTLSKELSIIRNRVFCGCTQISGEIKIPETVESIGVQAFSDCHQLSGNLEISSSVKSIGKEAFYYCTGLNGNLVINEGVESIGDKAFYNCYNLTGDIIIPNSVKSIGNATFYADTGFSGKLRLSNQVKFIGTSTFAFCSGLSGNLVLPINISEIGGGAFKACSSLEGNLEIPESVTKIGAEAFAGCSGLSGELIIPVGVKKIELNAFGDSYGVQSPAFESITIMNKKCIIDESIGTIPVSSVIVGWSDSTAEEYANVNNRSFQEYFYEHEHSWDEGLVTNESTCVEMGQYTYNCKICGEIKEKELPLIDHIWEGRIITLPSCTENGIKRNICLVCDLVQNEEILAKGHVWNSEYNVDKEATCTENGIQSIHCSVCDKVQKESETEIPAKGHNWDEGKVVIEPGCEKKGEKLFTCTACDTVKTEEIAENGHKWNTEFTVDKEATCLENGSQSIHCSVCDAIQEGSVEEIPVSDHSWNGTPTVDQQATCEQTGVQSIHCSICNAVKAGSTEQIPLANHKWNIVYVVDKAPTCTVDGSKSYHCSVCNAKMEGSDVVISATGHTWGTWNQTVFPTVKTEGTEERECSVCHEIEERSVAKLPLKLATVKLNKLTVASGDHMKISWKKVDGADGYLVYRRNNGKWQQIAKVKGNNLTYTDKTTKIGTKYTYTVKAYTDLEDETVYGGYNKTGVTLTQTYYKSSVKLTSAKATSTKAIQIKWKTRSKADGYIIYRKTPGSKWKKIATVGKKSSYTDKKCKSATTYLYTVKAYTKVNGKTIYSNYDNSGIVATTKMLKPTIKVSSKTKKKATISWSKQSNVSGYAIYRKKAGGKWSKIRIVSAKKSSYVDKNLKSGKTYYYAVKACIKANPKVGIDEPIYSAYNTKKVKIK